MSYINDTNTAAKPVVLYKTPTENTRAQRFVAAALLVVAIGTLTLQANWVYNANAEGAPVTSPVTSEESPSPSATASPSASPSVSPSPSDSPVTAPEVSPSPTNQPSNGGSNGGNGGNNNNSNSSGQVNAPSCSNEAPKSAPVIISAVSTGKNEITLNWSKAEGNVSEYVIAYGLVKGKPLYGAQFGNINTTSIKGLSGGSTYFFRVRAGNGCMPGAYSQEIAVKVGGKFINSPAQGFKPGVLGASKNIKPANSATPAPSASSFVSIKVEQPQTVNHNSGLFGKIANFFNGFFH